MASGPCRPRPARDSVNRLALHRPGRKAALIGVSVIPVGSSAASRLAVWVGAQVPRPIGSRDNTEEHEPHVQDLKESKGALQLAKTVAPKLGSSVTLRVA